MAIWSLSGHSPGYLGPPAWGAPLSGSEKGVFWKSRGLFRKLHFQEILENLEILEFLEE